jgi:putative Mn2+ efflux pump MntP
LHLLFIFNSILLGIGLAMDAFSVSLANGLNEPKMRAKRVLGISGMFALFQWAMPLTGWVLIHTIAEKFNAFYKFIPWIALILLVFIGIKMIIEGIRDEAEKEAERSEKRLSFKMLLVQAVATSIDALSVGFTIADYKFVSALCASLIIGVVTWAICIGGLIIGKRFGMKFARIASYLGGAILIIIGIEIFVSHMFS